MADSDGAPVTPPQTLREVDLKSRIRRAGHSDLREVGEFFGWEPTRVIKSVGDFTVERLTEEGWTEQRLLDVAEGYEHIARLTPGNPSAEGRAEQLRTLAELFGKG